MDLFGRRQYVEHLEAEIAWLKMQMKHERDRAEQAIDRLLSHAGTPPVSAPEPRLPDDIAELLKNPEFTEVGQGP